MHITEIILFTIVLQRIYLVVVPLLSCLQDHPLAQIQHHPSHQTNLTYYGRFLLKGHHNQVVKVKSVLCDMQCQVLFLSRPFLKLFNLMVAGKYRLLAAGFFFKGHLDEC